MKVIKNVLGNADDIRNAFIKANYEQQDQSEEGYSCRFKRSFELEKTPLFHEFGEKLCSVLQAVEPIGDTAIVNAYKMEEGDYFRTHDDKTNGRGFVYYLCKDWDWDWGGILMMKHRDSMLPILPKFNHLLIMDFGVPHFVTPVMKYAKEPRYAMVGFIH